MRDLDGRSIYTRPGSERYATRVQLTLEERLINEAQRHGAPYLSRADAAMLIGADARTLDAQLCVKVERARAGSTTSGLRLDQAAALYHVLTSPRIVEILVGPAGSGKTRTLVHAAWAWQQHGGHVIGLVTSQGARNVLARAGVPLAENTSVFLGHLPGQRGALGIHDLPKGTLILIDEASMTSIADLADIITYAARHGHKVIVCGDHAQLAAVESGGGMQLLVGALAHVQLAEAVRFREQWEQDASLRLRAGDAAALEDYDNHGRIRGGSPDTFRWRGYGTAEHGLWATAHSAQGRTVTTGIALVTGSEDAQWLYSAMTRGADTNIACVFTHSYQDRAETSPRSRADPELARNELILAERNADSLPNLDLDTPVGIEPADPSAVLASILSRDAASDRPSPNSEPTSSTPTI